MSLPERFYRIARYKLNELRDQLERMDAEYAEKQGGRQEAEKELVESINPPVSTQTPAQYPPRTVQNATVSAARTAAAPATAADPLAYHFALMGLPPGSDLNSVERAYQSLAARADPARFPEGSQDAATARSLRDRIENSYKILRENLDMTTQRFDRLEFDKPTA